MEQYITRQQGIYQSFRDFMGSSAPLAGTLDDRIDAGCLLVLGYGPELTTPLAQLSRNIAAQMPALIYDENNLHTTLATGPKMPPFKQSDDNHRQLFNQFERFLHQSAAPLIQTNLARIHIRLEGLIYNSSSLIAAGQANQAFWDLAEQLTNAAQRCGLSLNMPWGSHITVSRFLPEASDPTVMAQLVSTCALPGQIQPGSVQLVWFECDARGFRFIRSSR